jgi:hypothetical protein
MTSARGEFVVPSQDPGMTVAEGAATVVVCVPLGVTVALAPVETTVSPGTVERGVAPGVFWAVTAP